MYQYLKFLKIFRKFLSKLYYQLPGINVILILPTCPNQLIESLINLHQIPVITIPRQEVKLSLGSWSK